jgi:hypothetical protein
MLSLICIFLKSCLFRFCTSRVEAIKYLMQDETAKKGELAKMKKGLLADGWITDPKLPKVRATCITPRSYVHLFLHTLLHFFLFLGS